MMTQAEAQEIEGVLHGQAVVTNHGGVEAHRLLDDHCIILDLMFCIHYALLS